MDFLTRGSHHDKNDSRKRAYWAEHVKEWKKSGESKRSYACRHNLKSDQLGYWVQIFEVKSQTNNKTEAKGFVTVSVTTPNTPGLTVKLPNGLKDEKRHPKQSGYYLN